jgi:hypothetical protein
MFVLSGFVSIDQNASKRAVQFYRKPRINGTQKERFG